MSRMSTPSHRCPCPQVVIAGASATHPPIEPSTHQPPKLKAKWCLSHQALVSQAGIAGSLENQHLIDIDVASLPPTSSWLSAKQWAPARNAEPPKTLLSLQRLTYLAFMWQLVRGYSRGGGMGVGEAAHPPRGPQNNDPESGKWNWGPQGTPAVGGVEKCQPYNIYAMK